MSAGGMAAVSHPLAVAIVLGSVVHAMQFDGTKGIVSRTAFCGVVLAAAAKLLANQWLPAARPATAGHGAGRAAVVRRRGSAMAREDFRLLVIAMRLPST